MILMLRDKSRKRKRPFLLLIEGKSKGYSRKLQDIYNLGNFSPIIFNYSKWKQTMGSDIWSLWKGREHTHKLVWLKYQKLLSFLNSSKAVFKEKNQSEKNKVTLEGVELYWTWDRFRKDSANWKTQELVKRFSFLIHMEFDFKYFYKFIDSILMDMYHSLSSVHHSWFCVWPCLSFNSGGSLGLFGCGLFLGLYFSNFISFFFFWS